MEKISVDVSVPFSQVEQNIMDNIVHARWFLQNHKFANVYVDLLSLKELIKHSIKRNETNKDTDFFEVISRLFESSSEDTVEKNSIKILKAIHLCCSQKYFEREDLCNINYHLEKFCTHFANLTDDNDSNELKISKLTYRCLLIINNQTKERYIRYRQAMILLDKCDELYENIPSQKNSHNDKMREYIMQNIKKLDVEALEDLGKI